jgi:zinc transport system substrate-binding protein
MRGLVGVAATLALLAGAACGGEERSDRRLTVVASFYPLAWAAERIAGSTVEVVNLTPPGAEPHDLELSPRDVETIRGAALVVYVGGGFQPGVEDTVRGRAEPSVDVLRGESDPHVWLDPVRFASIAERVGRSLGRAEAAESLASDLRALDADFRRGLARCRQHTLVTTHAAFAHLASRYGLAQLSLSGTAPESEPGPRELADLIDQVEESGATTIFGEPLASDRVARTVARATGADIAVLDPLEGLSEERLAAGDDYLSVMRSNLSALRRALGCR